MTLKKFWNEKKPNIPTIKRAPGCLKKRTGQIKTKGRQKKINALCRAGLYANRGLLREMAIKEDCICHEQSNHKDSVNSSKTKKTSKRITT